MNWRRVRLIFMRELRDQLRDRRTLFMIAVLPILLYPSLGIGLVQMTLLLRHEQAIVAVVRAEQLPLPPLVEGNRFAAAWFQSPEEARRLRVVTVTDPGDENATGRQSARDSGPGAENSEKQTQSELVAAVRQLTAITREHARLVDRRAAAEQAGNNELVKNITQELAQLEQQRGQVFEQSGVQVLMIVPAGFKDRFEQIRRQWRPDSAPAGQPPSDRLPAPKFVYNVASEKGRIAFSRVKEIYRQWKSAALARQLQQAGLPPTFADVLDAKVVDVADPEEHARSIWSKVLPALLVLMTLTGAFYPAVDVAAGEKERGTMETLLICPAARVEIVAGKFLTVAFFAIFTALLNLVSMGLTGLYLAGAALGQGLGSASNLPLPPLMSLLWAGLCLLPIAAMFSAVCLALATFARSTKEGQYYLTPILLATIGMTMFAQMPTVELSPFNSVLPVTGVVLLLKEFLEGSTPYAYLVPVLSTSFGYAAIAIWWAVEQFRREDVLFRESERLEPRLWLRKLLTEKQPTPSLGAAAFAFLLIMVLQLGAMRILTGAASWMTAESPGVAMARLLIVQQLAMIAAPVLILAAILTRSLPTTFRWRWPKVKYFAVGIILPLALMPLSATLAQYTAWFFPDLPDAVTKLLQAMHSDEMPLWLLLLAMALVPAICEELAFRGFLLSGFSRTGRPWLAIVLSALAFGLMHMIPQQAFNAALLGLVLGLLALRSGSLWPCILFHATYNATTLLQQRFYDTAIENGYPWWLLLMCLVVAALLISWLIRWPPRGNLSHAPARATGPIEAESRQPA